MAWSAMLPARQRARQAGNRIGHRVVLEGRTLTDADALRVQFLEAAGRQLDLQKLYCAVEIALYDLLGKARVSRCRNCWWARSRSYPALWKRWNVLDPENIRRRGLGCSKLGFRAYKMRSALVRRRISKPSLMRDAVGPDFDLMVDAHTWWAWETGTRAENHRQIGEDLRSTTSPVSKNLCHPKIMPATGV